MHLGTSALLVRDMPVGRLTAALPDRYFETDDPIDARMAFSPALGPDTAVTSVGALTVLCDPRGELTGSAEWLRRLSVGRKLLALVRHDADGLHGFSTLEDGTMRRRVVYQDGALVEAAGEPIPEEDGLGHPAFGLWRDDILTLVARVTGVSWAELEDARYRRLQRG
jgi:hypothetical protein